MAKTAILIDDDRDDLEFLQEAIKEVDKSLVCIPYVYCDEAIRDIATESKFIPNYIFIDINMPKISGDECLRLLRKNPNFDKVTITMFSTSMPNNVSQVLKTSGADFTFEKPHRLEAYHTILKRIFASSQ